MSRENSVGIKRATGWTAGVRFPAGTREFSFLHSVHTGSGTHPASYRVGTGAVSPGVKRLVRDADQLVKNYRHQTLMMETEVFLETSVIFNQLTRLIAREDFINYNLRESFRSYIILQRFLGLFFSGFQGSSAVVFRTYAEVFRILLEWFSGLFCNGFQDLYRGF
jgi:hypothetical protein